MNDFMFKDLRELTWMNISSCTHTNSYNFFDFTIFHTDRHLALGVHCYVQSEWFSFVSISMRDKRVTLCRKERQYWGGCSKQIQFQRPVMLKWKSLCVCVCAYVCMLANVCSIAIWGKRHFKCSLNGSEGLESNDILIIAANVSARSLWVVGPQCTS